jgi:hypothetical protein
LLGQTGLGVQGATGVQGIQGQPGTNIQGITGLNGMQGQTGTGPLGATGLQGSTGPQGQTGIGPMVGVETLTIGSCNSTIGNFNSQYGWVGAVIPMATATINYMAVWCTQVGNGTFTLAIYNNSMTLVAQTNSINNTSTGLITAALTSSYTLIKGTLYYLCVWGTVNGMFLIGSSGLYQSNSPYIAMDNLNLSSLPTTFTGSSSNNRYWIGVYP